jgi:hypothetical protein
MRAVIALQEVWTSLVGVAMLTIGSDVWGAAYSREWLAVKN